MGGAAVFIAHVDLGTPPAMLRRGDETVIVLPTGLTGPEQCRIIKELVAESERLDKTRLTEYVEVRAGQQPEPASLGS